eukprot:CAMPEP_0173397128 /NCGR_PEP_ID=MMETSP1356-20130122/37473_1 /TAXON_ID=77927 ORGANISM="Hemiselmis virescens, Strain PCC157" /NCGR_SAMPLE_ID=MMETSP1356 /ASSEMBLY_ACC=CAM_ASM_000847 /LENGTH=121 /DNA_ID=CAMNT_0014356307 /DNA_START=61 /DNA_END=423 /DNA_ORIENTATION=+
MVVVVQPYGAGPGKLTAAVNSTQLTAPVVTKGDIITFNKMAQGSTLIPAMGAGGGGQLAILLPCFAIIVISWFMWFKMMSNVFPGVAERIRESAANAVGLGPWYRERQRRQFESEVPLPEG